MKSEIRNIKIIYKYGAFGNRNSFGRWIYGKRPDRRTVACKNEEIKEGGMRIWSYWKSPNCTADDLEICETEFSKEEWSEIQKQKDELQSSKCNEILRKRKNT